MTTITSLHRAPLLGTTQNIVVPLGWTVEQIAEFAHNSLDRVQAWVRAPAGHPTEWVQIPRNLWAQIKPKVANVVMFSYCPGDSGLLKSVFLIAATVAVLVAAPYLAPVIGTIGTSLLSAAFLAGTTFLANKLFPTAAEAIGGYASASADAGKTRAFRDVASGSNLLAKESSLPRVFGQRRISPPEIASPRSYLNSGVVTLDRVFAFDDNHLISDIEVDNTPIGDFDSITTEIKDGAEATTVATFIDKISNSVSVSEELPGFSTDGTELEDQETPEDSSPSWVRFSTAYHKDIEEITIRLRLDNFLKTDSGTASSRIPVRGRFRLKGSLGGWTNLPEFHLTGRDPATKLIEVRIRWDDVFGGFEPGGDISYEFFQQVPAAAYTLTSGSTGVQWQADTQFVSGAGLTDVQNVAGRRHGLRITLDEGNSPKGEFEWEFIRGAGSLTSSFVADTYKLSSVIHSFFEGEYVSASWKTVVDQGVYSGRVTISHATVVADQHPCQKPKTALLAVRSRAQSVRNVTCLAANYVLDWNGTSWSTLTRSENPAVQYRHILGEYLRYYGIDESLIRESDFLCWRQECIDRGYKVSAIFAGDSISEVLSAIAEAGFARKSFSDGYGVHCFRDRTAERPEITFSPRNSGIKLQWISPEAPLGVRAKFQDEALGYQDREIQIHAPGYTNRARYEVVEMPSIASEDLVRRRAMFDILQRQYQGRRLWEVNASIEGALCERGALVGIVTDLADDVSFGARIRNVIDTTTFEIDQTIPVQPTTSLYEEANAFNLGNIFEVGGSTAVLVSTPAGTEMSTVVAAEGRIIRVETAFSSTDLLGAHLVMAPVSRMTRRCFVTDITRADDETATLTLVDEAPEIFQKLTEMYG